MCEQINLLITTWNKFKNDNKATEVSGWTHCAKKFIDTTVDLSSGIYFAPPVIFYTMHECLEYKSVQICTRPSLVAVTSSSVWLPPG